MKEENLLKIYKYGDDILNLKAKEVKNINDRIIALSKWMTETMYNAPGVGLAAPQIGESIQLFTMDASLGEDPDEFIIMLNPVLLESEGEESDEEGCLSFPGINLQIKRPTRVLIKGITLQEKEVKREFEGFKARVIQHEIDHLNGVLIIDRLSSLKRSLLKNEIKKLKKSGQW